MWRIDDRGVEMKNAAQAFEHLRRKAQRSIAEGDRRGVDLRGRVIRIRDEAGNILFEGTLAKAAVLQFGTDAAPVVPDARHAAVERLLQQKQEDGAISLRTKQQLRILSHTRSDVFYRMSSDWREMCALDGNSFIVDTRHPRADWLETYIPQAEQSFVMRRIQRAISGKSIFYLQHHVVRIDGTIGLTRSCAVPVLDVEGALIEWLGTAIDLASGREGLQPA